MYNNNISVAGLLGLTRNIAEEDIQDFTYRSEIPVVSPFLPDTNILPNTRTTRARDMEQEEVNNMFEPAHEIKSPAKRICVFEHSVMTNFNCACPAIQRGQGSGFLSEGFS